MTPTTMRALVARGGPALEVCDVPRPDPGAGQVRVAVDACGICGSDLQLRRAGLYPPGLIPGHEMAGTVEALGPEVEGVSLGAQVAVEPFDTCGTCVECQQGWSPLCPSARLLGVHTAGGLAEAVVVDAQRLFVAPQPTAPEVLALAEPLAVSIHGLRRGGLSEGQRVLVVGAGAVGLLTLLAARSLGAGEVWITARHDHQAELARQLGATRVLREEQAGAADLARLGRDAPIDLAVETVGSTADTLNHAAAAVRPGGTVAVLGVWMAPVALDTMPLLLKELSLVWSYCYHHPNPAHQLTGMAAQHGRPEPRRGEPDFAEAVALLARQPEVAASLVSHRVPLADAPGAFALAEDKASGALKVSVLV